MLNYLHASVMLSLFACYSTCIFVWLGCFLPAHAPSASCPSGPSWAASLPPGVWNHSRRSSGRAECCTCCSWSEGTPGRRTAPGRLREGPHAGRTPVRTAGREEISWRRRSRSSSEAVGHPPANTTYSGSMTALSTSEKQMSCKIMIHASVLGKSLGKFEVLSVFWQKSAWVQSMTD